MRDWPALLLLGLAMGCGPAGIATPGGLSSVATAIEAVGSTATGFKTTQSAAELNGADKGLVEAQTVMTETQVEQSRDDQVRLEKERIVTARLLRGMSADYHEPVFLTLAAWVEAGGDPDFAFKYALAHIGEGQTKILPQQTALVGEAAPGSQVLTTSSQIERPQASGGTARRVEGVGDLKIDEALDQLGVYQGLLLY